MKITLFQGIVYGVFILSAIVGVFAFSLYKGDKNQQDVGAVVVWGVLPRSQFEVALNIARENTQNLKGVTYVFKNPDTIQADLISAIAEGKAPDLVLISHEFIRPLMKVITPISATSFSERNFLDKFAAGTEIFLKPDGSGSYGIPFLIDPIVLYVNRRILASNGIANPPTTWEALTGLVPGVTVKTQAGTIGQALIALGSYANVHNARGILSTLFLQGGVAISGVSLQGVPQASLGTSRENSGSPGQSVLRFYTQFVDSSKVSYTWNSSLPDSQLRFLSGDLALYLGYASEVGYIKQANPNLDFDVAPALQLGSQSIKSVYGLMYGFVLPRGAKNPNGAFTTALALSEAGPNQAASVAAHMAPANRQLLATRPSAPEAAVAYASALYAKGWLSPAPRDTDSVFSSMITNVTSGRFAPETALLTAEGLLTALLQK